MTSRARLILGVLLSLYVLVVLRAFQIQVLGVREIRDRGAKQYGSSIPLLPQRGVILDRTGTELAVSIATKSIFVQPAKLRDPDKAADLLAPGYPAPPGSSGNCSPGRRGSCGCDVRCPRPPRRKR